MNPAKFIKKMLEKFISKPNINKMGFLSSFFVTKAEDITEAEFITLDIERTDEDVAPVLRDMKTGAITINQDVYTNKTIKPPAYALDSPLSIWDLIKRQPGETEYENLGNWLGKLMKLVIKAWEKMFNMIKRSIEVQASQILQTGTLNLTDEKGESTYILDFKPKATHFADAGTSWSSHSDASPLDDIDAMADVISDDGLVDVTDIIMGNTAVKNFLQCTQVKELADIKNYEIIKIAPRLANKGARYIGTYTWGGYSYNIWTYNARFVDFSTRVKSKFLAENLVVLLPSIEDLDFRLVYGGIPQILDSMPPFNQYMPSRVTIEGVADLKARVYADQKAETITCEVKARPICIPVSIDRFGIIDTEI